MQTTSQMMKDIFKAKFVAFFMWILVWTCLCQYFTNLVLYFFFFLQKVFVFNVQYELHSWIVSACGRLYSTLYASSSCRHFLFIKIFYLFFLNDFCFYLRLVLYLFAVFYFQFFGCFILCVRAHTHGVICSIPLLLIAMSWKKNDSK